MSWTPMRDFEQIRVLTLQLQMARQLIIDRMMNVQREVDADVLVPLPDLADEPTMPNLTPQLIGDVIDQLAMRACSVMPNVYTPAMNPADLTSTGKATDRVRVLRHTYSKSAWTLQRRRAMRHFNGYDTMALLVEIDPFDKMPKIRVRNPLEAFPEQRAMESDEPPEHVAFITRHSGANLRHRFPHVASENGGPISDRGLEKLWDIVEWHDSDQIAFGLLGPVEDWGEHINNERNYRHGGPWMPLGEPVQNKTGNCMAIVPHAVTLNRIGNRLNRLIGNVRWQNRLLALDVQAQEKAIFPDMYIIGRNGMQPTLVDGEWKDGRTGDINLIEGADGIGTVNQVPDQRTTQLIDRLQYAYMSSAGLDPQMYGEARGASLRTGRALSQMASVSLDPRIQELHEIEAHWMPHVNARVLETYKAYFGSKKYTVISKWPGDEGHLEFTPKDLIETSDNTVSFAFPGADVTQVTQIVGALHGSDLMSSESAQRAHPYIDDPQVEKHRVASEKLDRATLEGLMNQVAGAQMPIAVFARIREKFRKGNVTLEEAIVEVDEEIRAEQLAQQEAAMQQQQAQLTEQAVPGLAAGPAAAAPGAPLPQAPPEPPQSPAAQMRQMLQAAAPGG